MKITGSRIKSVLIALGLGGALLTYQNCSGPQGYRYKGSPGMLDGGGLHQNGGTTTDNPKPTVSVQVGSYEDIPNAPQIFLCVAEIRFEKASNGADDTRINMASGESRYVNLRPEGTVIQDLDVPTGNYERIRMRLSSSCDGISAAVANANGEFALSESVDMEFSGRIVVSGSLKQLALNMDSMIASLAKAKSARDVQRALEEEGSCD